MVNVQVLTGRGVRHFVTLIHALLRTSLVYPDYVNSSFLAPVIQKVDGNAIHRINHDPLDGAIGFAITYPLDSD